VIRGVLSPHIDFRRGGPTYTWAYHALAENCQATTFIILGVAHQACRSRFILTEKDFETPLGILQTDRDRVRHLAQALGPTAFEDEIVHRDEHSIEFQTVFLQHALGHRRPIRIVPILVGSFHDLMVSNVEPCDDPEVKSLLAAFREIEASSQPGSIAYIGGIDLGHVGPQFGDVSRVHAGMRAGLREFDMGMLDLACRIDPKGWFARSARTADRWRTCGLAATYVFLHAIGPNTRGRILRYDQAVDADETCGVSFASAIFESVRAVT
jgi:AmmeMemoRadiSam system protein B